MFFEVKVKYNKSEDAGLKSVTESFVIDTLTFGSAEGTIYEVLSHVKSDIVIMAIKKLDIVEVVQNEDESEFYHLCVARYLTVDDKRANVKVLFQTNTVAEANKLFNAYLFEHGYTGAEVTGVTKSQVVDCVTVIDFNKEDSDYPAEELNRLRERAAATEINTNN